VYTKETSAVADHYKALGKFEMIKGEGTVEEIFEALSNAIETQMAEQSLA
jgi:adenylate kinase